MLLEGTGLYFGLLFLIFFIVYVTVKISLGFLLTRAKEQAWKAYVPFYTTLVLVDLLELKRSVFYFSLIPIVNLYYYYIIISKLLEAFAMDSKKAIWYIIFPMYKFPELAFKRPKFRLNEYDLTKEFLETQNALFAKPQDELPEEINLINLNQPIEENSVGGTIIAPTNFNQVPEGPATNGFTNEENPYMDTSYSGESVFTKPDNSLDEKQLTYVQVPTEDSKQPIQKPIITPVSDGRPKMCPNCGAKLSPEATTCFLCGHHLTD